VGTDDLVFPPQRVTKSDLNRINTRFREASQARDDSHTSVSDKLNLDPSTAIAIAVKEFDPAGWIKIQAFDTYSFRPEDTATGNLGWIRREPETTQFFHQRMPELEYLNGVIGYFRARQTAEGLPHGTELRLKETVDSTASVFSHYTELGENTDDVVQSAAQRMRGVMLALLAEKHMGVGWQQAHDQFAEAVRTAPENTAARNLLALSEVALWSQGDADVNQAIRALTRVLLLRPNDLEALTNLKSVYSFLEQDRPAAVRAGLPDVAVRKAELSAVINLIDP
jgi:hypothetical protein